jgi:hypothetical protein
MITYLKTIKQQISSIVITDVYKMFGIFQVSFCYIKKNLQEVVKMGVWSQAHYDASARQVLDVIKEAEAGRLPAIGDYEYYIVWGGGNDSNCRWIELPQESFDQIKDAIKEMNVVKEIREMEVGYTFYESAFIKICV